MISDATLLLFAFRREFSKVHSIELFKSITNRNSITLASLIIPLILLLTSSLRPTLAAAPVFIPDLSGLAEAHPRRVAVRTAFIAFEPPGDLARICALADRVGVDELA